MKKLVNKKMKQKWSQHFVSCCSAHLTDFFINVGQHSGTLAATAQGRQGVKFLLRNLRCRQVGGVAANGAACCLALPLLFRGNASKRQVILMSQKNRNNDNKQQ